MTTPRSDQAPKKACSKQAVEETLYLQTQILDGNGWTHPAQDADQPVVYSHRQFTRRTMIQNIDRI